MPETVPSSTIDQVISMGDYMDGQARVLVFFQGHVDEGRLAESVRLTLEAEPILGYRFVDHPRRPYWHRVDRQEWDEIFHVFHPSPTGPELFRFMVDPVLPERAPQLRAGLFRSEDDVLCIRSNHMTVDGGGAVQLLYTLASIYRELERDPQYRPPVGPCERPSSRRVLKQAGLLSAVKALPSLGTPAQEWGVPKCSEDRSMLTFTLRQIGPERLAVMRAYAKEREVTINDILLAAFCRSLFVACDPPRNVPLRVEVPTNLRRHLSPEQPVPVGDLSGVYFLAVERRDEKFEDTLRRVHEATDRKKKDRTELGEMLLLELALLPGPAFLKGMKELAGFEVAHPVVSNLGVIDTNKASFGSTVVRDIIPVGPVLYPPNVGLNVSTFDQRMTVGLNYSHSAVEPQLMERLLGLFLDELPGREDAPSVIAGSSQKIELTLRGCGGPQL